MTGQPAHSPHWLVGIDGEARDVRLPIEEQSALIGRSPLCDLKLSSLVVSRFHCRIWAAGGAAYVLDLGSTNGTCVNEVYVGHRELRAGDRLSVGGSIFLVE